MGKVPIWNSSHPKGNMMPIEITGVAALAGLHAASETAGKVAVRTASAVSTPEDTASLSPRALSVPALTQQALSTADARAARVEALRHAVTNAAYNIDPTLVAEAILSSSV